MTLHGDAAAGVLTQATLDVHLRTCKIDAPSTENGNGTIGFTALAIAARNGQSGAVRLLLDNNANVDALSTQHRTPLWTVTARGRGDSRAEIVDVLLKHKADAKYSHANLQGGSTPLVNELKQLKDPEVIQLLVDANGTTDAATKLAAGIGDPTIDDAMKSNEDRTKLRAAVVVVVVSLIQFILAWANSAALTGIANKIFTKFKISGNKDSPMAKKIAAEVLEPKTKEDFKKGINDFVDRHKLDKFFPAGDSPILETLASKAVDLQNDDNSVLGQSTNAENLVKFALYQPVIYCDDSGSMSSKDENQKENRLVNQQRLVRRIASICTQVVPDGFGVHLRFINKESSGSDNLRLGQVEDIMSHIKAKGKTEVGTNLRKRILDPLVYKADMERPIVISIITDGVPEGAEGSSEKMDTLKHEILECKEHLLRKGLPPRAVVFQLSQIGSDQNSKSFLDGLKEDDDLKGILYVTARE
ncbi:uncharacterized protein KY384_002757 [Bacidia gigantensis]|uniref:uncharacterized protein n=1 Tax=Bacidia gigantensis TaxID=2732470 RepID=UPI001D05402B|nr:uncharacterized protein KY384_002757 [Bacidia gigantensis]KAG8532879.1 hypothetical protein KY384_002757 [Bacidia gigantensis]